MEEIKLHQFTEKLELAGYLPRTVEDYLSNLRLFVRYLAEHEDVGSWSEVSREHLRAYQSYVQFAKINKGTCLSAKSVCSRLGALKTFYRVMHREGLMPRDLSEEINLPVARKHLPRHVPSPEKMRKLLEACTATTPLGLRDRAILELLYATAIRSEELRTASVDDYDLSQNRLFIRGKGAKDRVVPVGAWVAPHIVRYLEKARPRLVRNRMPTDLLFVTNRGRKMGRNILWRVVDIYAHKAGIKNISPHGIRHACATHLLHNGADIRIVQELLGHSSLASTQVYTRVEITQLHKAHSRFHPREQW